MSPKHHPQERESSIEKEQVVVMVDGEGCTPFPTHHLLAGCIMTWYVCTCCTYRWCGIHLLLSILLGCIEFDLAFPYSTSRPGCLLHLQHLISSSVPQGRTAPALTLPYTHPNLDNRTNQTTPQVADLVHLVNPPTPSFQASQPANRKQ